MNRPSRISVFVLIILGSVAGGFYARHLLSSHPESAGNAVAADSQTPHPYRPDFSLLDLDEELQSIDNWNGQVIMVNFWATWCPPCRREIPAFIRLYENYRDQGFVILGVAIDDPQSVQDFVDPMDVNYPILLGEETGIEITTAYGNRLGVLPFTVFIDREGRIIHTRRRELNYEQAEALIKPLL